LSGLFVTVVALVALVGILGERLGLLEAVTTWLPPWLTVAAVLVGGFPIFRNVVRAPRNRSVTSHALMTLGILGALAIGQPRRRPRKSGAPGQRWDRDTIRLAPEIF